jgi:predicted enzyme related to lactoylglutathione lyase
MNEAVGRIQQIAITVANVDASLIYYRDILGLKFLFSPGPNLAFLTDGSVRIMLSIPQGAGAVRANSILYFQVSDIEKAYESIVARGSAAERPPQLAAHMPDHDLWIGFLRDPDGNLIGLMEEKRGGNGA